MRKGDGCRWCCESRGAQARACARRVSSCVHVAAARHRLYCISCTACLACAVILLHTPCPTHHLFSTSPKQAATCTEGEWAAGIRARAACLQQAAPAQACQLACKQTLQKPDTCVTHGRTACAGVSRWPFPALQHPNRYASMGHNTVPHLCRVQDGDVLLPVRGVGIGVVHIPGGGGVGERVELAGITAAQVAVQEETVQASLEHRWQDRGSVCEVGPTDGQSSAVPIQWTGKTGPFSLCRDCSLDLPPPQAQPPPTHSFAIRLTKALRMEGLRNRVGRMACESPIMHCNAHRQECLVSGYTVVLPSIFANQPLPTNLLSGMLPLTVFPHPGVSNAIGTHVTLPHTCNGEQQGASSSHPLSRHSSHLQEQGRAALYVSHACIIHSLFGWSLRVHCPCGPVQCEVRNA